MFAFPLLALAAATLTAARPSTYDRLPEQYKLKRSPILHAPSARSRPLSLAENTDPSSHSYDENWAGAVISESTATYTTVTATLTVPELTIPSGGNSSTQYTGVAWVGIDGDTCDTTILQTGIGWYLEGSNVSYYPWYEWYPDEPSITPYADADAFSLEAGDEVVLVVHASSLTSGTASVTNKRTGDAVTMSFPGMKTALCEFDAEWIVENYASESGSTVTFLPFADFHSITFASASASSASGAAQGPGDSSTFDIQRSDVGTLTSTTVTDTSVVVDYV